MQLHNKYHRPGSFHHDKQHSWRNFKQALINKQGYGMNVQTSCRVINVVFHVKMETPWFVYSLSCCTIGVHLPHVFFSFYSTSISSLIWNAVTANAAFCKFSFSFSNKFVLSYVDLMQNWKCVNEACNEVEVTQVVWDAPQMCQQGAIWW